MYDRVKRLVDGLSSAVMIVCNVVLVIMTGVIVMLVTTRNFMGFSYAWSEELTRYLLVWLSMLGAAVLLRRDDHIALDLLPNALPSKARVGLVLALRLPVLAFLALLLQQSWLTAIARATTRAPALGVSISWAYAAIPVMALLMLVFGLFNVWADLRRLRGLDA
jgi:TRAP-type C4-dicarboxylate transport system permease small subunit